MFWRKQAGKVRPPDGTEITHCDVRNGVYGSRYQKPKNWPSNLKVQVRYDAEADRITLKILTVQDTILEDIYENASAGYTYEVYDNQPDPGGIIWSCPSGLRKC